MFDVVDLSGDNMERAREHIVLIQQALAEFEDLTTKIIQARWKFEMLARRPELGIGRDPSQPNNPRAIVQITANDLAMNIIKLTEERETAQQVLLALTGVSTVDGAREVFRTALDAFQRNGELRGETTRLVDRLFRRWLKPRAEARLRAALAKLPAIALTEVEVKPNLAI